MPWHEHAQKLLQALWVGVVPALLAALVMRYLVPGAGTGASGWVAALAQRFTIPLAVALFFVFAALARYWRFRLPLTRYASTLPAHLLPEQAAGDELVAWADAATLYERLRAGAVRRRLERTLTPETLTQIDRRLDDLRESLVTGDSQRRATARASLEESAQAALAWNRRRELVILVGLVVVVSGGVLALRALLGQPYRVLGASMVPTFEHGDILLGNKARAGWASSLSPLRRGDVIVFRSSAVGLDPSAPQVPDVLVKRVVGLPGDRLAFRGTSLIINGWTVPTCDAGDYEYLLADPAATVLHVRLQMEFLGDRAYLTVPPVVDPPIAEYVVAPGRVFVLGDNRRNSADSRTYGAGRSGGVPVSAVEASADRFLVGTHLNGQVNFGHFLSGERDFEHQAGGRAFEGSPITPDIARCLRDRPKDTQPPPPPVGSSAGIRSPPVP